MQQIAKAVRSCQEIVNATILQHWRGTEKGKIEKLFSRLGRVTSCSSMQEKGLENVTVAEVLMSKEDEHIGPWLWCHSNDTVQNAVKNVSFQLPFTI